MKNSCYELISAKADRQNKIVFYDHAFSISRFIRDIDGLSGGFADLGLNKGDVVSLYLPTCPQSLAAFYACSKLGLVANFIHPTLPLAKVKENLAKTNSKALLFFDALTKDESVFFDCKQILVRCSVADYEGMRKPLFKLYSAVKSKKTQGVFAYERLICSKTSTQSVGEGDDVVCYMHSGGTTGEAKIVALTNQALNFAAESLFFAHHAPFPAKNLYSLVTLPIFHAYGLCSAVHFPLLCGYGLVLVPKFDCGWVRKYINKYKVAFWLVVPSMLRKLLAKNSFGCKGMKHIVDIWCGGDFADESLLQQCDEQLKKYGTTATVLRGYGLTETCGACLVCTREFDRKNSEGVALPNTSVKIHDDGDNDLPVNTVGEIVMYTPALMKGYLGGGENITADGGLRTGDIGYRDEDGFVYVLDRKKRSVKIAAINVFPSEIERCVCENLSFVSQCCVVGYKQQGKQFLKAFVVINKDVSSDEVAACVKKVCEEKLSKYCRPEQVEIVNEIPVTRMGKVDFLALEKRC